MAAAKTRLALLKRVAEAVSKADQGGPEKAIVEAAAGLADHYQYGLRERVSQARIGGLPLGSLLSPEQIDAVVARTMRGGAEIGELMKVSSAYYAPSAASPSSVLQIRASVLSGRRLPPSLLPIDLAIPGEASRVQHVGLQRNAVGGVFLLAPSALCGSPTLTWSKTG